MTRTKILVFFVLLAACAVSSDVLAQSAAPELYGVKEVILEYTRFDSPKVSDACSLSREQVSGVLAKSFAGTSVPAIPSIDAKPPMIGVARIQLIPQISTYSNESLECVSWIGLSAESHSNIVIPPVQTARSVRVIYWQSRMQVSSGQSNHEQKVSDAIRKMAENFTQQYRVAQPPEILVK